MTRKELFERIAERLIDEEFVHVGNWSCYESCRDDIVSIIEKEFRDFTVFFGEPMP